MKVNALLTERLPGEIPLTRDLLKMLEHGDNVVSDDTAVQASSCPSSPWTTSCGARPDFRRGRGRDCEGEPGGVPRERRTVNVNFGLRTLLLLVATLLFLVAVFSDTNQGDWLSWGLAVFAFSYVIGDLVGTAATAAPAARRQRRKRRGPRKRPLFRLPAVD